MTVITIYALGWFVLMVVGILNGALRVTTYAKVMPEIRYKNLLDIFLGKHAQVLFLQEFVELFYKYFYHMV